MLKPTMKEYKLDGINVAILDGDGDGMMVWVLLSSSDNRMTSMNPNKRERGVTGSQG